MERRDLALRLFDGTVLVLPATLASATTYTILEQERWFEKETEFLQRWLKPGMTVLDIGANLGVYSLPIARRVAPAAVYAYEPSSEARSFLERSRALNQAETLHLIPAALSDTPGERHLQFGASSELNRLAEGGPGEPVVVTSLDAEDRSRTWASPDFIKLDAEGEEDRILEGGRQFFSRHSPLVMFEMRQGAAVNEPLIAAFRTLGYGIYRALPALPLLVPHAPGDEIDGYELNLFAAKPDRAGGMAAEGMQIETLPRWTPDAASLAQAFDLLKAQIFATPFAPLLAAPLHPAYREALAAYSVWRTAAAPMAQRCAALRFACEALLHLCEREATVARLSSLARFAWEWGRRSVTVVSLQMLMGSVQKQARVIEPFWPASPRFDAIAPGQAVNLWFLASAAEQLERSKNLSSYYGPSGVDLDWLCRQPWALREMERRRVLQARQAGKPVAIPERLRSEAPDHLNADIWCADLIPTRF